MRFLKIANMKYVFLLILLFVNIIQPISSVPVAFGSMDVKRHCSLFDGFECMVLAKIEKGEKVNEGYLQKGKAFYEEENWNEAVVWLEKAYQENPKSILARDYLSSALIALAGECQDNEKWEMSIYYGERAKSLKEGDYDLKKALAVLYNNYAVSLLNKGKASEAQDLFVKANQLAPDNMNIKKNLSDLFCEEANTYFKDNDFGEALESLKKAESYSENINTYILAGEIYYQMDDYDKAEYYWNKAIKINPGLEEVKTRIEKLKKEKKVEKDFLGQEYAHFKVKFKGSENWQLADEIINILESAYWDVGAKLDYYPKNPVTVIVYPAEEFIYFSDGYHWIGGIFDGKIRIKSRNLQLANIKRILYHEYAHAVIYYASKGQKVPLWFHEGVAQYMEPESEITMLEKGMLCRNLKKAGFFNLDNIDKRFKNKKNQEGVRLAYAQAKSIIIFTEKFYGGQYMINLIIKEFKNGKDFDEILKNIFLCNMDEFRNKWMDYLQDICK